MNVNRPISGTALARLWDAYDDQLRGAGVLMVNFGAWRQAVSRGDAPCSNAEAISALNADISVARGTTKLMMRKSSRCGLTAFTTNEVPGSSPGVRGDVSGPGRREVRRERAHGHRLLQRLPHLRHDQHLRDRDRGTRRRGLRGRELRSAPFHESHLASSCASRVIGRVSALCWPKTARNM